MRDPNQKFVVTTISRSDVASRMNELMGEDAFTPDDDRLTDEICQKVADIYDDAAGIQLYEDSSESAKFEANMAESISTLIDEEFGIKADSWRDADDMDDEEFDDEDDEE